MESYEYEARNDRWHQERGRVRASSEDAARAGLEELGLKGARIWPTRETERLFSSAPSARHYSSHFRPARRDGGAWVYTTRSRYQAMGGLLMIGLAAGVIVAALLFFFPEPGVLGFLPASVFGAVWFAFAVAYLLWELRLTLEQRPRRLTMVLRVGPCTLSQTTIPREDVDKGLLQSKRFFLPGWGHPASVGVQWRRQVSVVLVRKGAPPYQVDHSSDYEFERELAQRLSDALDAPLCEETDPSVLEELAQAKKAVPWLLLLWAVLMAALIGSMIYW